MAPRFRPEPQTSPGPIRTGILLCNLGTPDAPTTAATRRYLAEFLSDQRVVEIPPLVWKPLLHGIILRTRPAKSAAKYQTVWTPEGSPLLVWTTKQAKLLRGWLGEAGHQVQGDGQCGADQCRQVAHFRACQQGQCLQDHRHHQQGAGQVLQLLPRTAVIQWHDWGQQQVKQAEQGQIDRVGLLQEGCSVGFEAGQER